MVGDTSQLDEAEEAKMELFRAVGRGRGIMRID